MRILDLYRLLFMKKVREDIYKVPWKSVWCVFVINIMLHSIFSLQAFFSHGVPSYAVIRFSDKYYYLMQAGALFPISLQTYLVMASLTFLYVGKRSDKADFAGILKMSILTISNAVGVFFAIPCNIFYMILGYKFAPLVPLFITMAIVIGLITFFKYLEHYCELKLGMGKLLIVGIYIFSYLTEALIVR